MTPKEILIAAREIVTEPEHWTRGHYAASARGDMTVVTSCEAVCFCAVGAIRRAVWEDGDENIANAKMAVGQLCRKVGLAGEITLVSWNDAKGRTHAEVLALFDKAIEAM